MILSLEFRGKRSLSIMTTTTTTTVVIYLVKCEHKNDTSSVIPSLSPIKILTRSRRCITSLIGRQPLFSFFFFFFMCQWIDARREAPFEATCEKSVGGPCKVAGQGPQSESIRHYIDKECLEKNICADWLY